MCFSMICGSKVPLRSRGISSGMLPKLRLLANSLPELTKVHAEPEVCDHLVVGKCFDSDAHKVVEDYDMGKTQSYILFCICITTLAVTLRQPGG